MFDLRPITPAPAHATPAATLTEARASGPTDVAFIGWMAAPSDAEPGFTGRTTNMWVERAKIRDAGMDLPAAIVAAKQQAAATARTGTPGTQALMQAADGHIHIAPALRTGANDSERVPFRLGGPGELRHFVGSSHLLALVDATQWVDLRDLDDKGSRR